MTEFLIKNILAEILFENRICESLEDQQIVNYFYRELLLEKLLYGEPLTIEELRSLLRKKIVNFEFIKLNGEIRPAKGTTMMKYVPQSQHPKGIRPSSPKVATFYDLEKKDWRSVSQRSKEIVLKKDDMTGKPVIMVKDKTDKDVAVKGEQPQATVDGEPILQPPKKAEVEKVKPIEKTEGQQRYYFVNPATGATMIMDLTPKDTVKKLKELGPNWELTDEDKFKEHEQNIKNLTEPKPEEESPSKINTDKRTISTPNNIINKQGKNLENIEADEIE